MNSLIDVFRMSEIPPITRAQVIVELGSVINAQFASNITEPLVYELVKILDPNNKILSKPEYHRNKED